MIPDARELHRVITVSVHELLETARLEAHAGPVDEARLARLIFRAAAPIVQSVASLTEAQRGEVLPNIVRVMLAAFSTTSKALLGLLEPPLDGGQHLPGMDQRDRAQAEPIRHEACEGVDTAFALVLAGRDEAGRHARAVLGVLEERQVVGLAQLDLDRQGVGLRHRAADDTTRRGARQPGEGN